MTTHAKEPGATPSSEANSWWALNATADIWKRFGPHIRDCETMSEMAKIIEAHNNFTPKNGSVVSGRRAVELLDDLQEKRAAAERELTALRATAEQLARALAETLPTVRLVLREMRSMNDERSLNLTNKVATAEDALTAARELKLLP
jgi:hypothetical protein